MSVKEFALNALALMAGFVLAQIVLTKIVPTAWGGSASWEE